MKYIFLLFFLMSCYSSENEKNTEKTLLDIKVDSLIALSKKNTDSASIQLTKSDSTVTEKIDKTVKKIQHLETEVKQLKAENNELKNKLDDANDGGKPFRIRTISNN